MVRKIYITNSDKTKLQVLIDDLIKTNLDGKEYVKDLNAELERAIIVTDDDIPHNVITMHSKVHLLIDLSEEETVTLVYPNEIDITGNKISVLSPIGTAILGYREGDIIEWKVPDGIVKILVKKVLYQPEAAQNLS
jgi:regulator of nucleoside diphosphate kinase